MTASRQHDKGKLFNHLPKVLIHIFGDLLLKEEALTKMSDCTDQFKNTYIFFPFIAYSLLQSVWSLSHQSFLEKEQEKNLIKQTLGTGHDYTHRL